MLYRFTRGGETQMGYTTDQVLAAAKVAPNKRSDEQNAAVASDSDRQSVRNELARTEQRVKTYGE